MQLAIGASVQSSHSLTSQLAEAGVLMGVGMLSVFIFLAILIIAMLMLGKLVAKFPGQPEQIAQRQTASPPILPSSNTVPQPVIAAISAAVHQHRNK
ncbi:OadG family transporter subunit [Alteromonas sp. ASW11-36]|uniref:Probable oxaloacetate decarboxylase gamma chain n=1 Tax=Alteromonas arenosi TaxID=3055817 RepID=A0ABT7SV88_9ALTE|nr:OadG family transporter subunit [Alteromonas sp. ASW11-36]MDM7860091.1 OadG family transporter subunit [Alteromonas sp. ASW11-36]